MEYDINRIEFVKTQKTKYIIQTANIFFKSVLIPVFTVIFKSFFFIIL